MPSRWLPRVGSNRGRQSVGTADSETTFTLLLDRLKEEPGDLVEATTETIRLITRVCGKLGARATLNLAVTDA